MADDGGFEEVEMLQDSSKVFLCCAKQNSPFGLQAVEICWDDLRGHIAVLNGIYGRSRLILTSSDV